MSRISDAVLVVPRSGLLLERVGGLTVLERHLFTMSRAGAKRVWIGAPRPAEAELAGLRLPPVEVRWAGEREGCRPPYAAVSADRFLRVDALREALAAPDAKTFPEGVEDGALRESAPAASRLLLEDGEGTVVEVVPADAGTAAVRRALPEKASAPVEPAPADGTLAWLLAAGPRAQDGFMARHFDRRLSLAVSRLLLDTPVTPNMMTVASSLIGLAGALFFLETTGAAPAVGAALIWLHSVLDGCDGELARIRFQETPFGRDLDFWGDNLVHLALFGCLGIGFARADRSLLPLGLGLAAGSGSLASAAIAFVRRRRPGAAAPAEGVEGSLSRLENALAQRDFIYLLLLLALVGRTYEFLWAAAVGSLLFFAMTLYLGRHEHEHAISDRPRQGEARGLAARDGSSHQHLHSGS